MYSPRHTNTRRYFDHSVRAGDNINTAVCCSFIRRDKEVYKNRAPCLRTPPWVFLLRRSRQPLLATALAPQNFPGLRRRRPEPPEGR